MSTRSQQSEDFKFFMSSGEGTGLSGREPRDWVQERMDAIQAERQAQERQVEAERQAQERQEKASRQEQEKQKDRNGGGREAGSAGRNGRTQRRQEREAERLAQEKREEAEREERDKQRPSAGGAGKLGGRRQTIAKAQR
ncbi:octapeptide-repeat protein T2-like [Macrobrachium rosenbergii]|uniref:octapeptide-repeat protein T2-like n=1 Tax=Macrobrachium rosenbergii TaxID=79674 RepID=UPI0034D590B3